MFECGRDCSGYCSECNGRSTTCPVCKGEGYLRETVNEKQKQILEIATVVASGQSLKGKELRPEEELYELLSPEEVADRSIDIAMELIEQCSEIPD
jgi:hypothetical protein